MISGFCNKEDEKCIFPGYYTVSSGNSFPVFRDNLLVGPMLMAPEVKNPHS